MPPKPKGFVATCPLCNKDIATDEPFMQEEIGWAKPRSQGGTNALALRHVTARYAHALCVQARGLGIDPGQETLL